MFAFLAEHRGEVFPDEQYADLFSSIGRPSLPATRMAAVLTLQALHELSDRECAEAVRCDLRWKVACGLSLLDEGFDPSSLTYWRQRIANSERPHRINDAIRQVIEATGVLAGRRRRAVDSTILDDAVATQDTVTQLISAIRRVGRQVPGGGEVIAAVCTGHDYTQPGKPRIDWTDPDAKQALVSALVDRRERGPRGAHRHRRRARRDRRGRGGVAGAGGRAGRGTRRGLRRARRAVADRPEGGPGPGDLHRRRAGPAHPQVPEQPPRRLPRAPGRRTRDRVDHRRGADHGRRSRQRRRRSGADGS